MSPEKIIKPWQVFYILSNGFSEGYLINIYCVCQWWDRHHSVWDRCRTLAEIWSGIYLLITSGADV